MNWDGIKGSKNMHLRLPESLSFNIKRREKNQRRLFLTLFEECFSSSLGGIENVPIDNQNH